MRRCRLRRGRGPFDDRAQLLDRHLRIGEHRAQRLADLAQVVRRQARRHAHRDAIRAVAQEVREAAGQHRRLRPRLVVVGLEVDRLLLEVGHHLHRDAAHARFRVAHGRGRIAVDRAEVPLAVDERVTQREVLRHAHERRIDDRFAVRVVVARGVARDLGALPRLRPGPEPQVVHRDEDPALARFQPVADVGQRPVDDHAHRVPEVRRLQLLFDVRLEDALAEHFGAPQAPKCVSEPELSRYGRRSCVNPPDAVIV